MKPRLIITIALLVLVAIFLLQNAASVEVRLFVFRVEMPRALLILLTLAIGIVVGWFVRAMYRISRRDPG